MGWFSSVKDSVGYWGSKLWHHKTVADVGSYSYKTVAFFFEQIGVLPKVVYEVANHPPTRKVVKHLAHITAVDLVPLVLVTYTNHFLQMAGQNYLDDHENPEQDPLSPNSYMAIQVGLYLLSAATWTYSAHAKLKLLVNTTLVTLEAPVAMNEIHASPPNTICAEANCSTLRFLQGSVRDLTTYFATEAAISVVGFIPYVGGTTSALLAVYHRGRYVLTVVLPDLCNRHQMIYLREHSELALSLGLGHAASVHAIDSMIEATTGISPVFYKATIEQITLITQMAIAAQLKLPHAPLTSSRSTTDPVRLYQDGIGYTFDIFSKGLKTMLLNRERPRSVKEIVKTIPWSEISSTMVRVRDFPLVHVVLPKSLHGSYEFINDPIIRDLWPTLQAKLVNALKLFQTIKDHPAVRLSSKAPESAITMIWLILGTPKPVTRVLLQLLSDDEIIDQLRQWQNQLERLSIDEPKKIEITPHAYPLRGQDAPVVPEKQAQQQPVPIIAAPEIPPQAVIRSLTQARHAQNTDASTPSLARLVIRQRARFFKNPAEMQEGRVAPIHQEATTTRVENAQEAENHEQLDEEDWLELS